MMIKTICVDIYEKKKFPNSKIIKYVLYLHVKALNIYSRCLFESLVKDNFLDFARQKIFIKRGRCKTTPLYL